MGHNSLVAYTVYKVYQEGRFKNCFISEGDALKYLQRIQPHSYEFATRVEGWKIKKEAIIAKAWR